MVCSGCGYESPPTDPTPFRCPRATPSDDTDHVLRRVLNPAAIGSESTTRELFTSTAPQPFIRYRRLLHSHAIATSHGLDDLGFCVLVEELDRAVARLEGHGFEPTPFLPADELGGALGLAEGLLWFKDETGNVSGTHKGRHMFGLALWMEVARRVFRDAPDPSRQLAIASCGNAALAAAIVARAANRALDVFIPPWADAAVVDRLRDLRARLVTCPRDDSIGGDPCFHRFRETVEEGALPFTCQGSENGLVIEGGKTLVWEVVSELLAHERRLDQLFIQVGGGALGSACVQGLREARDLGVLERLPTIHTVQTTGASPLHRAWDAIMDKILLRHQREAGQPAPLLADDAERAAFVRDSVSPALVREELRWAANHRSDFMWPWEEEPRSVATGILDDETYDWLVLLEGMLTTGGMALVVQEETLVEAHRLVRRHTGVAADPTGSAGLAGLLDLQRREVSAADETTAILLTGVER